MPSGSDWQLVPQGASVCHAENGLAINNLLPGPVRPKSACCSNNSDIWPYSKRTVLEHSSDVVNTGRLECPRIVMFKKD